MPLPKAYLTSVKNLDPLLKSIQQAKAPERFTQRFLEALEFKSSSDRLSIGVLKELGFLDDQGKPTDRYFRYLDDTQSKSVMAEGIKSAYADLFQVNTNAHKLSRNEIMNKFKTLTQGQYSESVLEKMAMTFSALVRVADFDTPLAPRAEVRQRSEEIEDDAGFEEEEEGEAPDERPQQRKRVLSGNAAASRSLGGLHYNIQIILPESRDPSVYDALFRSLREHLV